MNDITTWSAYLKAHNGKRPDCLKDDVMFDKADEYYKLENQIMTIFSSMRKVYIIIQKKSDESYETLYWKKNEKIEELYKKLCAICDEVSLPAMLCPAIYIQELYHDTQK